MLCGERQKGQIVPQRGDTGRPAVCHGPGRTGASEAVRLRESLESSACPGWEYSELYVDSTHQNQTPGIEWEEPCQRGHGADGIPGPLAMPAKVLTDTLHPGGCRVGLAYTPLYARELSSAWG